MKIKTNRWGLTVPDIEEFTVGKEAFAALEKFWEEQNNSDRDPALVCSELEDCISACLHVKTELKISANFWKKVWLQFYRYSNGEYGKYELLRRESGKQYRQFSKNYISVMLTLSYGFKVCLEQVLSVESVPKNIFIGLLLDLLEINYNILRASWFTYSPPPMNVWHEMHILHYLAETYRLNDSAKQLDTGHFNRPVSLRWMYLLCILLSASNFSRLTLADMHKMLQFLEHLVDELEFVSNPGGLRAAIVFSLKKDRAPFFRLLTSNDKEDSWNRFIDVEPLLEKVSVYAEKEHISLALKSHIQQAWTVSARNVAQRQTVSGKIQVVMGLEEGFLYFSAQEKGKKLSTLYEQYKRSHSKHSVEPLECEVMNHSETGVGLIVKEDTDIALQGSELIFFIRQITDDNIAIPHLGMIRWLKQNAEQHLEFGVEFLAEHCRPMLFYSEDDSRGTSMHAGLLIESNDWDYHAGRMIIPPIPLKANDTVRCLLEDADVIVSIERAHMTMNHFAEYSFRVLSAVIEHSVVNL